jgi:hypothetical protein
MGRTIPSFRIALELEKAEWKPFRNALDKSDRKKFDEMWDIPRWYISACSNSVQYVRLHPLLMSILLYHYKQLTECISEVERIIYKGVLSLLFLRLYNICKVRIWHLVHDAAIESLHNT